MYEKNALKEYIKNSELRIFNNRIKIRLSKELATKYDKGYYTNYLNNIEKYWCMIDTLNIKYPSNANPIFYIYIVPDNNYVELLKFPANFDDGKGGGRPVTCFDLDGFNFAYGLSQNMLENEPSEETNIAKIENTIHELAHIVHSQFLFMDQIVCEGFAEALGLYALNLEEVYTEHKNLLIGLNENQILSAQEIINSQKDNSFGNEVIFPNKTCSFRPSYISSYLFVRGCMEIISEKHNLSKAESLQYFLEIVKQSENYNEYFIYDIADAIDFPKNELLNGKSLQLNVIKSLSAITTEKKFTK